METAGHVCTSEPDAPPGADVTQQVHLAVLQWAHGADHPLLEQLLPLGPVLARTVGVQNHAHPQRTCTNVDTQHYNHHARKPITT